MKILALTILFILAFLRVRNTPCALSKTLWKNKMIKQLKNNENQNSGMASLIAMKCKMQQFFSHS